MSEAVDVQYEFQLQVRSNTISGRGPWTIVELEDGAERGTESEVSYVMLNILNAHNGHPYKSREYRILRFKRETVTSVRETYQVWHGEDDPELNDQEW